MLTMSYSFGSQEGHDSALLTFLQPQHIHIPFRIQKASFTPRSPYPSPRTHPFLSLPHPASASASSGNNSNGAGSPSSPHLHCPLTCLLAHAPHFSSSHYVGMNRPCSHQKPNPFTVFQCPSHLNLPPSISTVPELLPTIFRHAPTFSFLPKKPSIQRTFFLIEVLSPPFSPCSPFKPPQPAFCDLWSMDTAHGRHPSPRLSNPGVNFLSIPLSISQLGRPFLSSNLTPCWLL